MMKGLILAFGAILAAPHAGATESVSMTYTIEMETPNATVSPGGDLDFIVHIANKPNGYRGVRFEFSDDAVVESYQPESLIWGHGETGDQPRHVKVSIKPDISVLPKTITLSLQGTYGESRGVVATASFYIKEGTHGHAPANIRGKHAVRVVADKNDPDNAWYELFCIGSTTGNCSFDIKDGEHILHTNSTPTIANHTCGDQGFPIRTLAIRQSLVFDSRRLIIEADTDKTIKSGYKLVDNAVCVFTSTSRFMLRPIDIDHISTIQ